MTVRNLAIQYPQSSLNSGPLLIYLTARSSTRGEEAVKTLLSDPQLKAAKALKQDGGLATITFSTLDISDVNSINRFKEFVTKEHAHGIDILVNNAGIFLQGFGMILVMLSRFLWKILTADIDINVIKTILKTNYYGTLAMATEFLPLIRPGGRVVNVASSDGQLIPYSEPLKQAFVDASNASIEACTVLMEKFVSEVLTERETPEGWPSAPYAYAVSKAGEIAFTKAMARDAERNEAKVLINVCCPGFVNTDMTNGTGTMTVDEGAKTPVFLALGDIGGTTGGFWKDEVVIKWRLSIDV